MSPGSVTEKLHFFVAEYDPSMQVGSGGGIADEGEDIEVLELPIDTGARHDRRRPHRGCQDHHAAAIRGAEYFQVTCVQDFVVPARDLEVGVKSPSPLRAPRQGSRLGPAGPSPPGPSRRHPRARRGKTTPADRVRAAKPVGHQLHQTRQLLFIDRARRVVGPRDVRRKTRQSAGIRQSKVHPFAEIEIDKGIAPGAAMLLLERRNAVAQRCDPVGDHQPKRFRLGIEMMTTTAGNPVRIAIPRTATPAPRLRTLRTPPCAAPPSSASALRPRALRP